MRPYPERIFVSDHRLASVAQAVDHVVVFVDWNRQNVARKAVALVGVQPHLRCSVCATWMHDDFLERAQKRYPVLNRPAPLFSGLNPQETLRAHMRDGFRTRAIGAYHVLARRLKETLELHRAKDGWPTTGPIFRTKFGTPLSIDNIRCRQIIPAMMRCEVCGKAQEDHAEATHDFKLDEKFPKWHGWHAFRRGLATDLEASPIKVAQGALRHADPATTMRYYQKTIDADVRRAVEERSGRLGISLTDTSRTPNAPSSEALKTVN